MSDARSVMQIVSRRIGRVLDVAEAAIPADRFPAFRKVILREFGYDEFGAELTELLRQLRNGKERNGPG